MTEKSSRLRLSTVQFGAGSGTLCLNLNPHQRVRSSLLPDLNPEVRLRCGCEPGAPEVRGLKWAKYGKRSQKQFPGKSPNLWFRCRFGPNSHLPHLEPEPRVRFRFAPGSAGLRTRPRTVYDSVETSMAECFHLEPCTEGRKEPREPEPPVPRETDGEGLEA